MMVKIVVTVGPHSIININGNKYGNPDRATDITPSAGIESITQWEVN